MCDIHFPSSVFTQTADMQTLVHLRSLEGRQNIGMLLLVCSCNERSSRTHMLGLDQIKTPTCKGPAAVSAGRGSFSLTLHRDLEGAAITLVFHCHLTPVAPSISGDHFDDLHFVGIDLGEKMPAH